MSRSTSIWLVVDETAHPVAAFTVKHELSTWLAKRSAELARCWWVYRMSDNPDRYMAHEPQRHPAEELL